MIERLNERVTFQHHEVTVDQYGNHRKSWEDYFSCSVYANTYAKDEESGVVSNDERQIVFECRYCSELAPVTSSEYRAIFRGDVYNILSVDMMNYRKKMLKFKCQKVER